MSKSKKSQNSTKLLQSAISFAKQIKSWYGVVIKEEEEEHSSIVQNWVESLSNSPELILALQDIN
jgi:hypothetical protein